MLIEIHMLQNHSPANLNRDDLGAPKTCMFGGVTRARISSQCLKRSIRNPGNREDVHNPNPGMFAQAMGEHMGTRTKLFPWLVEQALADSAIPEEEHGRIVLAAKRIAQKGQEMESSTRGQDDADDRPKTPQLIHLGPGHARSFVSTLEGLRSQYEDEYKYFLHPVVGFKELVSQHPDLAALDEKERDKIVKASWTIANCRMDALLQAPDGEEAEVEPALEDGQPGAAHAALVAERLAEIRLVDGASYKALTKGADKTERDELKEKAPDEPKKMKQFQQALNATRPANAIDIALFGRMTTSVAFEDVEAAMQVAHAISTHEVVNEVDYFTAVDDLGRGPEAGHLGETQYNSACFYKYFCLDWDQLVSNLAGPEPKAEADAKAREAWVEQLETAQRLGACAVGHFLRAAAQTSPSGKQNSFASHCEPCGILVEIKDARTPTSYANAFAEPVRRTGPPDDDAADESSIEGRSVACLADHVQALRCTYSSHSKLLWYSPKLWRFPLQHYRRQNDGKKHPSAELVTEDRFCVLGGTDVDAEGLVEAVVKALPLGLTWSDVRDAASASPEEAGR